MFLNEIKHKDYNLKDIKKLGKTRSNENLELLIKLFDEDFPVLLKREIVSSIGRHKDNDKIYDFLIENLQKNNQMEIVFQMFRTCLYKMSDSRFYNLKNIILKKFENEVLYKMDAFYSYKHSTSKFIKPEKFTNKPILLEGDNSITLQTIPSNTIQLIFTSPPYYNAREYSNYYSYKQYLDLLELSIKECVRVLEPGRFMIINVSPVISPRPGREFESTRYPIHFDIHNILINNGLTFSDEILWIKPEPSVPYRIGSFIKNRRALTYKPKNITESILVYRKFAPFLIQENLKYYSRDEKVDKTFEHTNCWNIAPASSKLHPAIFPDKLCENIIELYSFENDIVLDPYAGIGTFGKVALKLNRIPILCEMNSEYLKEIRKFIYSKK